MLSINRNNRALDIAIQSATASITRTHLRPLCQQIVLASGRKQLTPTNKRSSQMLQSSRLLDQQIDLLFDRMNNVGSEIPPYTAKVS